MGKYHDYSIKNILFAFPCSSYLLCVLLNEVSGRKPSDILLSSFELLYSCMVQCYSVHISFRIMHLVCNNIVPYIMYLLVFPRWKSCLKCLWNLQYFYPDFNTIMFRKKANLAFILTPFFYQSERTEDDLFGLFWCHIV